MGFYCIHNVQSAGSKPPNHASLSVVFMGLFLLALAFLLSGQKTNAATVVIKFPADLEASTRLTASEDGGSLVGSLVRVGSFKTNPVAVFMETATLTDQLEILDKIESQFLVFGSFPLPDISMPREEYFQLTEEPLSDLNALNAKNVFLLFYNADKSELTIFRSKEAEFAFSSPTDSPIVFELGVSKVDQLLGFYSFAEDRWETGKLAGGVGRIFSPTNATIEAGDVATFFIRANHGANHFAVTNLQVSTNGGISFSNTSNSWISVATNTGELTLAAPENDTNATN